MRSRSLLFLFLIPAAVMAPTGCSKAKPKPETRVAQSLADVQTDADAAAIDDPTLKTLAGKAYTPDGAPDGSDFGSTGGLVPGSNPGFGAGTDGATTAGADAFAKDSTGSLPNTASMDGVENAMPVADLEMVHFEYDSSNITPDWQAILEKHAAWISQNPKAMVQVEGHCDERGTEEYNIALGQRRADTVRDFLVSKGVDPNRLSTISYGKMRPMDVTGTEQAAGINRRAMFLVYESDATASAATPGNNTIASN